MLMSTKTKNESLDYQSPQVSEIIVCTEGILCGSDRSGQTDDLYKEDLGDIWY